MAEILSCLIHLQYLLIYRDLAYTGLTQLPLTDSIRMYLEHLFLEGSLGLRDLRLLYKNDPEFKNQTFPTLINVRLPYHAQCCYMRKFGYYRYIFGSTSVTFVRSIVQKVGSYLFGGKDHSSRKRTTRQALTESQQLTCINVTSQQCVNPENISLYNVISQEHLCNISFLPCLTCVQSLCERNCTNNSITLDIPTNNSVVCVTSTKISIRPTQTMPSLSPSPVTSLSSFYTVSPSPTNTPNCISNQVLQSTTISLRKCSTSDITPQPTPEPTTAMMTTEPPTAMIKPECQANYCDTLFLPPPDISACQSCQRSECLPLDVEPQSCGSYGDICDCGSAKRKRSVPELATPSRNRRNTDECVETVLVAFCVNCSSTDMVPNGWFRPQSNSQLLCTNSTPPPTTNSPDMSPPAPVNMCQSRDFTRFNIREDTMCEPDPDVFNPCERLLEDEDHLRIAVWFVIVFALCGNLLVIFVFLIYTCIIRRMKMDYFVVHFFYFNLALADLLLCIYLLAIAIEDITTLDNFSLYAIEWMTGGGCQVVGFMAILSTVVSVYILLVITLERGFTIMNAMHRRKVTKKIASVIVIIGWLLGLVLALLPVGGTVSDYGVVAICLPFKVDSALDTAYVVFLLLATGFVFVIIGCAYFLIFAHVFCKRSLSHNAHSKRKIEIKVAIRMFILVFTNFLCWFPIALVALASVFGNGVVTDLTFAKWAIVFIFPINSCLNPILYSLSTRVFRENLIILLSKIGLCKKTAHSIVQSRAGVVPSHSSEQGNKERRPTIVERIRQFSITSQSSTFPLFNTRRDSMISDSTISQNSEPEHFKISLSNKRRRSSVYSDSSNDDSLNDRTSRRSSLGTSLDIIANPSFQSTPLDSEGNLRSGTKASVSSLGPLAEENEQQVSPVKSGSTVKMNPAHIEEENDESSTNVGYTQVEVTQEDSQHIPQHHISLINGSVSKNDSECNRNYSNSPSVELEFGDPEDLTMANESACSEF